MKKTEYIINAPVNLTIALVPDLHERNSDKVIQILKEEAPDLVAIPGDLFENYPYGENLGLHDKSLFSRIFCGLICLRYKLLPAKPREERDIKKEYSYRLLREASKLAPILMSSGNHEVFYTEEDRKVMEETGTLLLDNSYIDSEKILGQKGLLFGGLTSLQTAGAFDTDFLESFSKEKKYKILLCHHPEYYPTIQKYPIHLILSGHCHGGQIRLFGHGIFSPGQGLFPKYHHGIYDRRMIVSSGCSNTTSIPRWGNEEEVVYVRLTKKEKGIQKHENLMYQ